MVYREGAISFAAVRRGYCTMKLSAQNVLQGTIMSLHPGAVNAVVLLELPDGQLVTSSISMDALKDLDLKIGQKAYAVIKASNVMIGIDD